MRYANLAIRGRKAAFDRYVEDPYDGAAPSAIVNALARLKRGELLSPSSTQHLLAIMSNTKTGANRELYLLTHDFISKFHRKLDAVYSARRDRLLAAKEAALAEADAARAAARRISTFLTGGAA